MNLRALPICVAIILAAGITGCGADLPVDETPTDSNVLANQVRVAEITQTTLAGYEIADTVQISITDDRLSLQGGGGTVPVVTGLKLAVTGTAGIYAGSRLLSGGKTETYTVGINADRLVTSFSVARTITATGTAAGGFTTLPPTSVPTIVGNTSGRWRTVAATALNAETGHTSTRMTIDNAGLLWWDLDGDLTTTDDVFMLVLRPVGSALVGRATILYDWDGDTVNDLVTLSVQTTLNASGNITGVLAQATPVDTVAFPGGGADWVNDVAPVVELGGLLEQFGPWSASMAGHWLAIPSSGTTTISGTVAGVVRLEAVRTAANVLVGPATRNYTQDETETVDVSYALDTKAGFPVVRMTVHTVVDLYGGGVEETSYSVYLARGSDGAVYRIGQWEDVNLDNTAVAGEESLYAGTVAYPVNPVVAFPASQPAEGAAYQAFTRWGITTSATHLRSQTFNGVDGRIALAGGMLASAAQTTPAPAGYDDVRGAGVSISSNALLTTYWVPGAGIIGMRWAGNSAVVRRFKITSSSNFLQVERSFPAYADLK